MSWMRWGIAAVVLALPLLASATTVPEAARARNDSLLVALLDGGADPDATLPTYFGATALMIAAERDDEDLAHRLLSTGASVDARDKNGDTALNWAAYYGHMDVARVLLNADADPTLAGHGTALEIALRRGHEELVQVLSLAADARTSPRAGAVKLAVAVYRNQGDAVASAIASGAEPDAFDDIGRPVLHLAARLGHDEALTELLDHGAAVDAVDIIGFTALMVAARESREYAVRELLVHGADVHHRADPNGHELTPLHLAAIGGNLAILRAIAAAGASLDDPGRDGTVPLLWALAEQHLDCVVVLIELGADPTLENELGQSVAGIAREFGITPVLEAIAAID